ncbi:hypothetical protein D3C76_1362700 [compost metagenome]
MSTGNGQGKKGLAAANPGKPALLLLFIGQAGNAWGDGLRMQGHHSLMDTGTGKLLADDRGVAEVATSPELCRQGHAQQTFTPSLQPQLTLKGCMRLLARQIIAFQKAPHCRAEQLMIFAVKRALNVHPGTFCAAARCPGDNGPTPLHRVLIIVAWAATAREPPPPGGPVSMQGGCAQ